MKQQTLLKQLEHIGGLKPQTLLPPMTGPIWGYRGKARLGVRYVAKKDRVLVGFRERGSSFITETGQCEVLDVRVGTLISVLSDTISLMQTKRAIPQIEVAIGDDQVVLVFRHLEPMPADDRERLVQLAQQHDLTILLQPDKPDTIEPLWPQAPLKTGYRLEPFDVRIEFEPTDFTQVNAAINRSMVSRAIELLELQPTHRVLDLFCGLGNFTLPIARLCGHVTGVEGSLAMVRKARENAALNAIENAAFACADLYSSEVSDMPWTREACDRVLLDPPRSGAMEILPYFKRIKPERIVYVSCHPATLARDAGYLVNELGYRMTHAGIMDMFPHTAHVESMGVFVC
jgi:23S rRNA (uracil1939-C5)-methyltransferase